MNPTLQPYLEDHPQNPPTQETPPDQGLDGGTIDLSTEPGPLGGEPQATLEDGLPPVSDPPVEIPPPEKAQPVAENERHTSLDLLRGFALLGILLMNMLSFSWPDGAYGNATHLYYAPDSIGEIPKPDKEKEAKTEESAEEDDELAQEKAAAAAEAKKKEPKPIYAGGEIRVAAVSSDYDRAEWVLARLLAENKMRTLFSMLFGAGVLLMADHARGKKISPAWLHYRRMFWMLLIGAAHAYFIWIGDILFGYACIGLAIFPMRWLSIRWLLGIGLFLFLLPLTIKWFAPNIVDWVRERGGVVAKEYEAAVEAKKAEKAAARQSQSGTDKTTKPETAGETSTTQDAPPVAADEKGKSPLPETKTEKALPATPAPGATDPSTDAKTPSAVSGQDQKPIFLTKKEKEEIKPGFIDGLFMKGYNGLESMRKEGRKPENMTQAIREHYRQSYWEWFTERWTNILFMHIAYLFLGLIMMGWPMIIGMGMMKWGFFTGEWSTGAYLRTALILYAIGFPSEYTSIIVSLTPHEKPLNWEMRVCQPLENLAMLAITLGNASFMLWLYKTGRLNWIATRLEAVGRMALSNYLFDSVFCTLLFSNIGPGLFAAIPRVGLVAITAAIWIFQLAISPIWLRHFRFGPMEWLWRSLTYWKIQPLRRATVKVGQA